MTEVAGSSKASKAACDDIGVIVPPARHVILARTAIERVMAPAAEQLVLAGGGVAHPESPGKHKILKKTTQKKGIASDAFSRTKVLYRALTSSGTAVNRSASRP